MKITVKVEEEHEFDGGNCEYTISRENVMFLEDFLRVYLDMLKVAGFEYVEQLVAVKENLSEVSTDINR